jgi:hypothetical protein
MSTRGARAAPAVLALFLAACGGGDAAKETTAPGRPATPPIARWFQGRLRQLPPWGDDLRRRKDPAADGWPTEVLGMRLDKELPERIRASLGDGKGLDELLAKDFAGSTVLWPDALETAIDDGDLTVRRAKEIPPALRPRAEFGSLVQVWKKSFGDATSLRADVWVDGITVLPDGAMETHVCVRVGGTAGTGSVQQNVVWRARWRAPGQEAGWTPELLELALVSAEEIRTRTRPFAELTRQVLGASGGYEEEILRGAEDYHLHQDRLSAQPMLGMHGLAVGDIDGDGLEDLYLPQPGGQPNELLIHQPDGTVKDLARKAGLEILDNGGSAMILDLDNDGDQDIATTSGERILIGWNDGHGRFTEHTVLAPENDPPEITSFAAADADGDGLLDLYACRYAAGGVSNGGPAPYWNAQNGAPDLYWHNDGGHAFSDRTKEAGLETHTTRFGLAVVWEDLDEDGQIDLYVVNDFGKNCFYKNDHGKFTEIGDAAGASVPAAGMGVSVDDVDHDGNLDLFLTNMDSAPGMRITSQPRFLADQPELREHYRRHSMGNTLLLGDGHGRFHDVAAEAGVLRGGWSWGGMFFDLQNDGWPDVYVPNGFATNRGETDLASFFWRCVVNRSPRDAPPTEEYLNAWDALRHFSLFEGETWNGRERNFAYVNLGGAKFAECSSALEVDFLDDARVVAPVDWDDDGRVDLWIRNRTGPRLRFVRNVDPAAGHWLALEVAGTTCNRDGIGAKVFVEAGGLKLRQTVRSAEGYMCGGSRRLHFGLGRAAAAERVRVVWPGGGEQVFENVAADARYRAVQGKAELERRALHPQAALASMPSEPVLTTPRDVSRIVLYERLPARELPLAIAGAPRNVASFGDRPLVVWVGWSDDPASRHALLALAERKKDLDALGAPFVALDAGDTASALPAGALAGKADKRFLQALQVLLMEVIGPFEKLAYPLVLLFDRGGQLTAVYTGEIDAAAVLADVALARALDPNGRSTEPLLRGRWARTYPRNLEGLGQIFDLLGDPDLGRFYHGLARARAAK